MIIIINMRRNSDKRYGNLLQRVKVGELNDEDQDGLICSETGKGDLAASCQLTIINSIYGVCVMGMSKCKLK